MLEDEDKSVFYVESSADISGKVYSSQGRYNQDRQNKIEGTGHSTAHAGDQSFIPTFVLCGAAQGSLMIISPDGLITSCVMRRGETGKSNGENKKLDEDTIDTYDDLAVENGSVQIKVYSLSPFAVAVSKEDSTVPK